MAAVGEKPMQVAATIVAAGRGTRAGGPVPKPFQPLDGKSVITRTLQVFLSHAAITHVQPVLHPEDGALFEGACEQLGGVDLGRLLKPAFGSATRQGSVRSGLEALAQA